MASRPAAPVRTMAAGRTRARARRTLAKRNRIPAMVAIRAWTAADGPFPRRRGGSRAAGGDPVDPVDPVDLLSLAVSPVAGPPGRLATAPILVYRSTY